MVFGRSKENKAGGRYGPESDVERNEITGGERTSFEEIDIGEDGSDHGDGPEFFTGTTGRKRWGGNFGEYCATVAVCIAFALVFFGSCYGASSAAELWTASTASTGVDEQAGALPSYSPTYAPSSAVEEAVEEAAKEAAEEAAQEVAQEVAVTVRHSPEPTVGLLSCLGVTRSCPLTSHFLTSMKEVTDEEAAEPAGVLMPHISRDH